jgi:hypothetical protein
LPHLHQRVIALGYVPVEKRQYIIDDDPPVLATANATQSTGGVTAQVATEAAAQTAVAPLPAATLPAATLPATANFGGQVARWENFWRSLWPTRPAETPAEPAPSKPTVPVPTNTNFWGAWWEQASEQSSKLLEQFDGQ